MTTPLQLIRGGNSRTKVTEMYLLSQPDVLDASVWMEEGCMLAHVTLNEGSKWTERSLRLRIALDLGMNQTPSEMVLMGAKTRTRAA